MHQTTNTIHTPVLLDAVLTYLAPQRGDSYLDLTAGYGGHARAILERTQAPAKTTLVDRDASAIAALESFKQDGAKIVRDDFFGASKDMLADGERYDVILADLGVSSLHLDTTERGFTFRESGPLDMRMDQRTPLTAEQIVNTYDEGRIAQLLREYGEEPRAKRIAAAIVAHRPLEDTAELAEIIRQAVPRGSRIHPATRSFQAFRIAVNDELGLLKQSLPLWLGLLAPGGRLAVISFHSLEDRLVKRAFAQASGERYDADFRLLTKRPVVADDAEKVLNPRSRSAKLRVVAKINNSTAQDLRSSPKRERKGE